MVVRTRPIFFFSQISFKRQHGGLENKIGECPVQNVGPPSAENSQGWPNKITVHSVILAELYLIEKESLEMEIYYDLIIS